MTYNIRSKLPAKVRIGPFDYKIVCDKTTDIILAARGHYGELNALSAELLIDTTFASAQKAIDTFLHECLHAIYICTSLQHGDNEERLVCSLSTGLVSLHQDNPWLTLWIAEALDPEKN